MRGLKTALLVGGGCLLLAFAVPAPPPTPYAFPLLAAFPSMPANAENPVTEEGVRLGRYLFYDPILSASGTLSCSSCHRQEAAFSDGPKARSSDRFGQPLPRNTPPLFNLAWYPALFWDGRAATVEEQVFHPVRTREELGLRWPLVVERLRRSSRYPSLFRDAFGDRPIDSTLAARAIAQFERTLLSYRSKYDRVIAGQDRFTDAEYAGFDVVNDMSKGGCLHCHATDEHALGAVPVFSNNGLDTATRIASFRDAGRGAVTGLARDWGTFKAPSLRNVALTAPYMHDGRFKTLRDVLDFYSTGVRQSVTLDPKMTHAHQGGVRLSEDDKQHVLAFLQTLTDSAFVADPAFSNPFH